MISEVVVPVIGLFVLLYNIPAFHDFNPSLTNTDTKATITQININPSDAAQIMIDEHPGLLYHEIIRLRTKNIPSGISIEFEPTIMESGSNYTSIITISADEKFFPENYNKISITSDGNDEKEHARNFSTNLCGPSDGLNNKRATLNIVGKLYEVIPNAKSTKTSS